MSNQKIFISETLVYICKSLNQYKIRRHLFNPININDVVKNVAKYWFDLLNRKNLKKNVFFCPP